MRTKEQTWSDVEIAYLESKFHRLHVGTIKGVSRICQQTFIDTYSRVAMTKLWCISSSYKRNSL